MNIKAMPAPLEGVLLIEPMAFTDHRGLFMEAFHQEKYSSVGIERTFVQDNFSHSRKGVLRGLHYQLLRPQAKLIWVIRGEIFDVVVDIRLGSPSFGKWWATVLSSSNRRQLFVPEGFAHGFYVLSPEADVFYKCTDFYDPDDDRGILWNDPTIGIEWPGRRPILSVKDQGLPLLGQVPEGDLPRYRGP